MDLTQESVISLLVSEGGQVKKSHLVNEFKAAVDCVDPAEKQRKRELFRTLVNNVAFVKEIDGDRFVILKKVYQHLLERAKTSGSAGQADGSEDPADAGERGRQVASDVCGENAEETSSPIELALQRSKSQDVRVKRMLNFDINKSESGQPASSAEARPFGLPLRVAPSSTAIQIHKLKTSHGDPPRSPKPDNGRSKRRSSSAGSSDGGSPQPRRPARSAKVFEETRISSSFPLEDQEHQWLVKCAGGHWSQVYGLLLSDCHLVRKKDFTSGFTVLHWAAKCGNSKMLVKIVETSQQRGVSVDIDARSHGGYTPLHVAALHDQEYVMAMLVGELGANASVRDNCGKRAYHYLHKGISRSVREMLGDPKVCRAPDRTSPQGKEEAEPPADPSRGLHSISRLFQPPGAGLKKKHSQRSGLWPLGEESGEERGGFRHRAQSDVSFC